MKKKGFTLVELLAVIVILAVIALIAVPIILNVIETAKKGAIKNSVYGIESAANLYYSQHYEEKVNGLFDLKNSKINYKGKIDKGFVYYGGNGKNIILIYDGDYCGYKYYNNDPEIGKVEDGKCIIDDKEIEEASLTKVDLEINNKTSMNGTEPVIKGDLIAVTISSDGTVKKADTNDKWYDYDNKVWANAVILKDKTITYNDLEVIPESNIESYFVWIPKYRYQLWNVGVSDTTVRSHSINIEFNSEDTVDGSGTCVYNSTNCHNGDYMTHPAFITMGVNGLWVGKFETGYNGATTTDAAAVNSNDSTKIIVKPNVYSWRNNTVMNMFTAAYNYNRALESHMMKNTEWGAVAYLSHSKYGINNEVNINNNSSYKTGYSSLLTIQQGTYPGIYGDGASYNNAYNTPVGYLASTTGNISGIYDMSGGAHEYVAAYSGLGSSGFNATTIASYNSKYFDQYNASSGEQTYQYRILGDATGEMGTFVDYKDEDGYVRHHNEWYGDHPYFVQSYYPWFVRGGGCSNGVLAGQFAFNRSKGGAYADIGSRLVLAD